MPTRFRSVVALVSSAVLIAVITACIPTGTAQECAGQVTTTTVVDCAWTTSTTTTGTIDPTSSSTSSVPTTGPPVTTTAPTTTAAPTTTTTAPATTTTTTRPPGDINDPWWAYKGKVDGPKVLVIGDSLILVSTPAINAALYPDHATQVMGLGGFKLGAADHYLAPYPATSPDVVVMEFGTNDATGIDEDTTGAKRAAWKAKYLEIAARFPATTCFVPVTMPAQRGWPTWDASNRELNDWLLATFPDTVDWNAFEIGQRAAGYDLTDHKFIHPEGGGVTAMAAIILGGVQRCLDRRSRPATSPTLVWDPVTSETP